MQKAVVLKIDKFSTRDGPGIRTVVFFRGCPLRCIWCHSPESQDFGVGQYLDGTPIGKEMTSGSVLEEVLKDKDFYEASSGGLTLSGGEVLSAPDFALELLSGAKSHGVHTAVETSGYAAKSVLMRFLPLVDLWLFDVKILDEKKHIDYTGKPLGVILDNLRTIDKFIAEDGACRGGRIFLRCPVIPTLNDDDVCLHKIADLANMLSSVSEIHVEPYIPFGIEKAAALGKASYEAAMPERGYGEKIVERLSQLTEKRVLLP